MAINQLLARGFNPGAGAVEGAKNAYAMKRDQMGDSERMENRNYLRSRDQQNMAFREKELSGQQLAQARQHAQSVRQAVASAQSPDQARAMWEAGQNEAIQAGFLKPEEAQPDAWQQIYVPVDPDAKYRDLERTERIKRQVESDFEENEGASFEDESKLRKEFQGLTKEFRQQESAMGRIIASSSKPSAAGDIALIFNFMKMLDPGSTVREGEFATAQNAAGVPEQVRNIYRQVMTGERLSPSQRTDFLSQAGNIYGQAAEAYERTLGDYKSLASQYKANPERVGIRGRQYSQNDFSGLGAPAVGDVVDGYVFKGGDPGDQANWKKK